jgi:hypothetical protein
MFLLNHCNETEKSLQSFPQMMLIILKIASIIFGKKHVKTILNRTIIYTKQRFWPF